jgi:cytochrome c oxidase cbb3-type subunit 1
VRLIGGSTFAVGMLLMAYNTWRTVRGGERNVQYPIAAVA